MVVANDIYSEEVGACLVSGDYAKEIKVVWVHIAQNSGVLLQLYSTTLDHSFTNKGVWSSGMTSS